LLQGWREHQIDSAGRQIIHWSSSGGNRVERRSAELSTCRGNRSYNWLGLQLRHQLFTLRINIYICMLILYNYNSYHFKHGFGSCIAGICFESKNLKGVTGSFYFFSSTSWFQTSKRGSPLVQFFLLSLDSSIAAQ